MGNPVAQTNGFPFQLAHLLPQLDGCDIPFTKKFFVRCPSAVLFDTEKFNTDIQRCKNMFCYTMFLSDLTGGIGCPRFAENSGFVSGRGWVGFGCGAQRTFTHAGNQNKMIGGAAFFPECIYF